MTAQPLTKPATTKDGMPKFDDHEAAQILYEIERTRKEPDRATIQRLPPDWNEGVLQAQQSGPGGTAQWLQVLKGRSRERHDAVSCTLDEVRTGSPITDQADGEPWEDPILVTATPAMAFPVDIFPDGLVKLVKAQAAKLSAPPDYLGIAALATASIAIGRSIAVRIDSDWTECAALYCVAVGKSGQSKSPSISKMTRPLGTIAKKILADYLETKNAEAKKSKDDQIPVPPLKRTIVDDATIESLGPILRDNPRGVGMVRDELTALMGGMDQYKSGKGNDRSFYLSAHSGAPWTIDRKNNPEGLPVLVPAPFLTIIGGMVNSKLIGLSEAKDKGDGFIERLLFAIPEPIPVRWCDEEVDKNLIKDWSDAVHRLWNVPMNENEGEHCPWYVCMDDQAKPTFQQWYDSHHAEVDGLDFPSVLEGAWPKLAAYCVRLALIIDRLRYAFEPTNDFRLPDISNDSMNKAIRLVEYFKVHARRAHDLMGGSFGEDSEDGRAILKWVRNTQRRTFNERDAKLNFTSRFQSKGPALDSAIAWLIGRRCIRPIAKTSASPKGGRPASKSYEVNPALIHPSLTESSAAG